MHLLPVRSHSHIPTSGFYHKLLADDDGWWRECTGPGNGNAAWSPARGVYISQGGNLHYFPTPQCFDLGGNHATLCRQREPHMPESTSYASRFRERIPLAHGTRPRRFPQVRRHRIATRDWLTLSRLALCHHATATTRYASRSPPPRRRSLRSGREQR